MCPAFSFVCLFVQSFVRSFVCSFIQLAAFGGREPQPAVGETKLDVPSGEGPDASRLSFLTPLQATNPIPSIPDRILGTLGPVAAPVVPQPPTQRPNAPNLAIQTQQQQLMLQAGGLNPHLLLSQPPTSMTAPPPTTPGGPPTHREDPIGISIRQLESRSNTGGRRLQSEIQKDELADHSARPSKKPRQIE